MTLAQLKDQYRKALDEEDRLRDELERLNRKWAAARKRRVDLDRMVNAAARLARGERW